MNIQKSSADAGAPGVNPPGDLPDDGRQVFTLAELLQVFRVRRNLIAGATIAVTVLATVAVLLLTPLYASTAVVMLDDRKTNAQDEVLSGLNSDPITIQNQVQILTSAGLADRVIARLRLDQDPEFDPSGTSLLSGLNPLHWLSSEENAQASLDAVRHNRIVHMFLSRLSANPIGLSAAMQVSFESADPKKAQKIANAVAAAYVDDQLDAKFEANRKTMQWVASRISELSRKTQDADTAVERYKAEHNIITMAGGSSVVIQQTADISSQLVAARGNLAEKQAAFNNLMALASQGRAADSAAALSSQVIAVQRAQETEIANRLADLSSRYLPGHPKILDLQAQKASIDAKIAAEVQRIVEAYESAALRPAAKQ